MREFLQSSIQLKTPDQDVANYLKTVKLSERLDDRPSKICRAGLGTEDRGGPEKPARRHRIAEGSHSGAAAPSPAAAQAAPSSRRTGAHHLGGSRAGDELFQQPARLYLLAGDAVVYQSLRPEKSWIPQGHMTERLSYFDHKEEYKTVTVNDLVSNVDARKLGRSLSRGEFGTMLREIFDRNSQTDFDWARWTGLRGQVDLRLLLPCAPGNVQVHGRLRQRRAEDRRRLPRRTLHR